MRPSVLRSLRRSSRRLLVVTRLAAAAGAVGAACARQPTAQVMTPVRLDPSTVFGGAPGGAAGDALGPFAPVDRIDWPGPSQYRSASGAPGPAYWQQRADYAIAATLDTADGGTVSGQVTIRYVNHSPDTLRFLWLQLDQNLYRQGSLGRALGRALVPADSRWGVRGFAGGYTLDGVTVDGQPATPEVHDTRMRLDLARPLPPGGGRTTIAMHFRFRVPEHGSDRMGREGTLFQVAQWHPRMAVYDDVHGWNADPYLGQGEFYLEYGDVEYSVTVPAGYVVAGSGVLSNGPEVLTAAQRDRLARARSATTEPGSNAGVVAVIGRDEATMARTAAVPGTRTWRFRAERVRDVAWAAAPDFRWDATSWNGVTCHAFYPVARAGRAWESAAEQTCWSIRTYSRLFYPYPYPQATSVAGPVGGMEYPMLVFVHHGSADPASIFETLDHEQGHQWFPMLVGSNERRYAWQDEGLDTYANAFSLERRYPGRSAFAGYMASWRQVVDARRDAPLMTRPDWMHGEAVAALGYDKPGLLLLTLRNHVVGAATFDRAVREYARRWAFRHPTPGDFFRTVENVSGMELGWFWRAFWYGTEVLDLALEGVEHRTTEEGTVASVTLRRTTGVPFPVALRLRLADGSMRDVRLPVDLWARAGADGRVVADIPVAATVAGARLWPDPTVPDWNPENDAWGDAPRADPMGPVTAGGLAGPIGR